MRRFLPLLGLFLVSLALYSIIRVEFLIWNWRAFQSQSFLAILQAIFTGIRFDIASLCLLLMPLLFLSFLPRNWQQKAFFAPTYFTIFVIIQLPFMLFNMTDIEMINFVGRRWTFQTLFIFNEAPGKLLGFLKAYGFLCVIQILIGILFFFFSWRLFRYLRTKSETKLPRPLIHPGHSEFWKVERLKLVLSESFYALLFLIIFIIGARGGLQAKPIGYVHAQLFRAPLLNNVILNSSFTVLKSYGRESLARVKYFSEDKDKQILLNESLGTKSIIHGELAGSNVVIIVLESFGAEYTGLAGTEKSYTPFLDSLAAKSLSFPRAFANGRRSIEGIAAIMAGIPALMSEPFISSPFANNYFLGMGSILAQRKYQNSFFHGGQNGTMYFDSFMKSVGVNEYFGKNEYPNDSDFDGVWGIYDGPFFNFFLQKINQIKQKFFTSIFSLSSHQPYLIPEDVKDNFSDGPLEVLKAVSYTDSVLRNFFQEAQKQDWFENTLFVITADHAFKSYLPNWDNDIGRYRIPLLFYHPRYRWPVMDLEEPVQQIDILPSVLDLLGIDLVEKISLARSVFRSGPRYVVNYMDGPYILIEKNKYLWWQVDQTSKIYSWSNAGVQWQAFESQPEQQRMENQLKASIQYFSEGMWDNRLYQ